MNTRNNYIKNNVKGKNGKMVIDKLGMRYGD